MKVIQIAACMTRGTKRDFANVYGLTDQGNVAQWDPAEGRWKPFKLAGTRERGDDRGGF